MSLNAHAGRTHTFTRSSDIEDMLAMSLRQLTNSWRGKRALDAGGSLADLIDPTGEAARMLESSRIADAVRSFVAHRIVALSCAGSAPRNQYGRVHTTKQWCELWALLNEEIPSGGWSLVDSRHLAPDARYRRVVAEGNGAYTIVDRGVYVDWRDIVGYIADDDLATWIDGSSE